ncbi:flavodoxin reductase [Pararhizobium haloflavum]|uniref:flavodoxin reductase n=1 Tax=Pararhizobium haloflavum TaxID=2037914 RepID=UPI000C1A2ED1|nr:flavodoxin reductase [Pararhizobium haloflavum]
MPTTVSILETQDVTHNVKRLRVEKPDGFTFQPGQATEVSVDKDGWREEKRPFTFTALPDWDDLEFTIKIYPGHDGVTDQIGKLQAGDRLILDDAWGTITYKGPGVFIAGGAGVTPFIAILRDLEKKGALDGHTLIFSNQRERDIILRSEFESMRGLACVFTTTKEDVEGLEHGKVDRAFLAKHVKDFDQRFYVCGPDAMVDDIKAQLEELGADADGLVFEQ